MRSNSTKNVSTKKTAPKADGAEKKTLSKTSKQMDEDDEVELDEELDETPKKKLAGKKSTNAVDEDEDDEDDDVDVDEVDEFGDSDDEFDLDKDFEEFDLPKSKKAAGGKKKAGDDEDFDIDDDFKDLGFFSDDNGFDDDDDDF